MEFRKVSIGFDSEAGVYFIADGEFRHLSTEAESLDTLRKKLETLELRPVLCQIYAKDAPEFRKPRTERAAVPKFKRLKLDDIPKRQRRGR
jgi:Domain of unknown function (DUF1902)